MRPPSGGIAFCVEDESPFPHVSAGLDEDAQRQSPCISSEAPGLSPGRLSGLSDPSVSIHRHALKKHTLEGTSTSSRVLGSS